MITSFNLFESEFYSIYEDKSWEDFRQYHINVKSKDGIPMTDDLGVLVFSKDPTPQKTYRKWLIDILYKNSTLDEYLNFIEEIPELLPIYINGKPRIPAEYEKWKNISNIKTFEEFKQVIQYIIDNNLHISKNVAKGRRVVHSDYKVLFENDVWIIIIPLTWAQSKKWANGANWCTAGDSDQGREWFKKYSDGSPLYIFHNKLNREENHQLWLGSANYTNWNSGQSSPEFRDYKNSSQQANFNQFLMNNKEFIPSFIQYWNTNDSILKNSLGHFLIRYLTEPREDMSSIADLILRTDTAKTIPVEYMEKILITGLESYNIQIVDKYFNENPKYLKNINKPLSNGMTPIMTTIRSGNGGADKKYADDKTLEMCNYLISKGSDATGTRVDGTSDVFLEALQSNKYRTALFLLNLDTYRLKDSQDKNILVYIAQMNTSKKPTTNHLTYSEFDEFFEKLIAKGFDVNTSYSMRTERGMSLLHLSIGTLISKINNGGMTNEDGLHKISTILKYGANPCLGIPPELESNKSAFEDLINLINQYKKQNGC